MTNTENYANKSYIFRAYLGDSTYIEVLDVRYRDGRAEWMTRYAVIRGGAQVKTFSYRWRKICGKGVVIKTLNRQAIDDHYPSLSIHDPVTHKQRRVYLIDFV